MENKLKIMIIDDESDLTNMIGFQFMAKGFEVLSAQDGLEALSKVHDFKPDLIIMDINMPRMGGIEFYGKICDPNGRPLYPVLVLTARANIQGLFKDLQINGFMIKPFEINALVQEAELIIKKTSQGQGRGKERISGVRRVCIVEHELAVFAQVAGVFLNAGYTVSPAFQGVTAMERMMKEVPDVALIQLGLPDIAGDIMILKLSQMARTMGIRFILYTHRSIKHDREIMDRIATKTGVLTLVQYNDPKELLAAADTLFL